MNNKRINTGILMHDLITQEYLIIPNNFFYYLGLTFSQTIPSKVYLGLAFSQIILS